MSIVKRNNLVFPALMNEIFKPDWFGGMENLASPVPAANIKTNEKDFQLELAVPGRKKEDFNIEIEIVCHEVARVSKTQGIGKELKRRFLKRVAQRRRRDDRFIEHCPHRSDPSPQTREGIDPVCIGDHNRFVGTEIVDAVVVVIQKDFHTTAGPIASVEDLVAVRVDAAELRVIAAIDPQLVEGHEHVPRWQRSKARGDHLLHLGRGPVADEFRRSVQGPCSVDSRQG